MSFLRATAALCVGAVVLSPILGCGGGDFNVTPTEDAEIDSTTDAATDTATDSALDTNADSTTTDTGRDSSDGGIEGAIEAGDVGPEILDTSIDGSGDVPDAVLDSGCVSGGLCTDGSLCVAGLCAACVADKDCASAKSGTLCYAGHCLAGVCHPALAKSGCSGAGALCCATTSSAGDCFTPTATTTPCCASTDCPSSGATLCEISTHTCVCVAPVAGDLHVSTTGSDVTGNGSATCPFKTLKRAVEASVGVSVSSSITLHKSSSPTVFGDSCTGGPPCDVMPVVIPATVVNGLTIHGDGDASDVVITGDGDAVLTVKAASVGFNHLTVKPTRNNTAGAGQNGIVFDAPSSPSERAIVDVDIVGKYASEVASGTGTGVVFRSTGGASPTIGPRVQITDGYGGILVRGTSQPRVTADTTTKTLFASLGGYGVKVLGTAAAETPSIAISSGTASTAEVSFDLCTSTILIDTTSGGSSTIDRVVINKGNNGIEVRGAHTATVTNTVITSPFTGFLVNTTGFLTIKSVSITTTSGFGAWVSGATKADVDGLKVTNAGSDGLRCDATATLALRNSSFLKSGGNGVQIAAGCTANLGDATSTGNNVFNSTSQKNAVAGLCLNPSTGAVTPTPSSSTFGCAYTGSGCITTGVPTTGSPSVASCKSGVDVSFPFGTTFLAPTPTCCN